MFVASLAVGFSVWMDSRPRFQVRRLTPVLARLEALQVKAWRDQDWCRCFQYQGGAFMWSTHESTCSLFAGKPLGFSEAANADFRQIREAVRKTRCRLNFVTASYERGHLVQAEFSLDGAMFVRQSYIYSVTPPEPDHDRWIEPLGNCWYLCNEDWN